MARRREKTVVRQRILVVEKMVKRKKMVVS